MKKNTIVVSFVASKGGAGKSTLITVMMNYLQKMYDLDIVLLETDYIQQTLTKLRISELAEAKVMLDQLNTMEPEADLDKEDLEEWSKLMDEEKSKYMLKEEEMYEIHVVRPADVKDVVENDLMGEVDIVFIDVPGSLAIEQIISAYEVVDYIFIPTKYGRAEIEAFKDIMQVVDNIIIPKREAVGKGIEVYGVLNKITPNLKEYVEYAANKEHMPIPFLNTDIPSSDVTFIRGFSTHKMYDYPSRPKLIKEFCEEIIGIITK